MIGKLRGKMIFTGSNFAILDVGGVGYKVYSSLDTLRMLNKKKEESVSLWTHLAVRETALDLYGFLERSELEFFEMLITISGIGPKSALGILSVAPADTLKNAVAAGDTTYLVKVSGIGKKNAEKIIVELRDKLGAVDADKSVIPLKEETEALAALEALGYSVKDARGALKDVGDGARSTEEKVKQALKLLGTGN